MGELTDMGELKGTAAHALLELLRQGKVGAGDLIKVLNLMEEKGEGENLSRNFVIRIREE